MSTFVYGLGVGFLLFVLLSLGGFYLALEKALNPPLPPLKPSPEDSSRKLEKLFSRFFDAAEQREVSPPPSGVSPPPFKVVGLILSPRLKGVFVKEGKKVLFVEEGKKVKGYALLKVEKEGALFERGGKLYRVPLRLKGEKGGLKRVSSPSGSFTVVSRREIEELTSDPAKMFTQIRLVPYVVGGQTKGFIFEWVKKGSLFERIGIRRGDVLLSVNNATIRSGEDAFRLLQVLRNEPNLKIVVLRKGKKEEINVRIE